MVLTLLYNRVVIVVLLISVYHYTLPVEHFFHHFFKSNLLVSLTTSFVFRLNGFSHAALVVLLHVQPIIHHGRSDPPFIFL